MVGLVLKFSMYAVFLCSFVRSFAHMYFSVKMLYINVNGTMSQWGAPVVNISRDRRLRYKPPQLRCHSESDTVLLKSFFLCFRVRLGALGRPGIKRSVKI